MSAPVAAPWFRPLLHMGTGLLALALGVFPYPWSIAAACLGVLAGWVVFPLSNFEARLRRPGEPFLAGLRTYPLAVLLLVILLPPFEAAAAWGVLAFGDGAAALVGQRVHAPAIFGHAKATWSGSAAYVLIGGGCAYGVAAGAAALAAATGWVAAGPAPALGACFAAAAAAAILDLVPLPPDDNVPAAAAAGGVLAALRMLT